MWTQPGAEPRAGTSAPGPASASSSLSPGDALRCGFFCLFVLFLPLAFPCYWKLPGVRSEANLNPVEPANRNT